MNGSLREKSGKHVGPPWYDGLICEVIRGISDIIAVSYDAQLDKEKLRIMQQRSPRRRIRIRTAISIPIPP